jgi:GH15 family glucan-1,4-alpha-glucosidase
MGRPVVLSNGQLFVGLDESGLVHDFYYPYVGLENLTTARSTQHKIGVWVNGEFSWTNDGTWNTKIDFEAEALISKLELHSDKLRITLRFEDFVDVDHNALVRRIEVTNEDENERDVRVFMHQVFQISSVGRADTAMYVPDDHYILDYKGRCCLLIAGKFADGGNFDQYAVGNYGIEGKAGTFMDAEDGELTDNAIEHAGVDSVIRFQRMATPNESFVIDYWVVAADSQSDAQLIHTKLKHYSIDDRIDKTRKHWHDWLASGNAEGIQSLPERERIALQKSLLVIKAHADSRGSILASGDSSIFNYGRDYYCYCWPRDAAYALWPLIRLGIFEEAKAFFAFARDTMHHDGYMMHKYQPDRAIGSTWHPLVHGHNKELAIQEDETAIVVYMIGEYYRVSGDRDFIENYYDTYITPCAEFMTGYIDPSTGLPHASYDLWEERFSTSSYTVSTVIAGLTTASAIARTLDHPEDSARWQQAADDIKAKLDKLYDPAGFFKKGVLLNTNDDGDTLEDDSTLDISNLYGPFMYAQLPIDDPRIISTAAAVESRLLNSTPSGGVIRYEHDNYFLTKRNYMGNPWIVCTLWLAQYYIGVGKHEQAGDLISWALDRQLPSGVLSEQFDPEDGLSLGVTPLVWSHAELVNTLLDYYKVDRLAQ